MLDEVSFFEGLEGAVSAECLDALGREDDRDRFLQLRYINAVLLEVRGTANLARGVELSSTRTVAVTAAHS